MKTNFLKLCICLAALWITASGNLFAEVALPKIIGNNMVLQRNKPLTIWGYAAKGEKVTVQFGSQIKDALTDTSGHWKVVLDPMQASDKPEQMIITATNTIKLENILVGEVWLCSGQSNMEYPMKKFPNYKKPAKGTDLAEEELKNAHNPNIRIFLVEKKLESTPKSQNSMIFNWFPGGVRGKTIENHRILISPPIGGLGGKKTFRSGLKLSIPDVTTTGWNDASDSALTHFSAVGYFFGKELYKELNIPIGIISSSWGGSRIEPWTPAEAYAASPVFKERYLFEWIE